MCVCVCVCVCLFKERYQSAFSKTDLYLPSLVHSQFRISPQCFQLPGECLVVSLTVCASACVKIDSKTESERRPRVGDTETSDHGTAITHRG